jgi:hypothetical protein
LSATARGPFFDASADHVLREMVSDIADEVAAQASADVHTNLNASIQRPTPYYETQIRIESRGHNERSVNDSGVVYGNWLEGTGSRNRTTRFKGYASFRRATQSTQAKAPALARAAVERAVRRLS